MYNEQPIVLFSKQNIYTGIVGTNNTNTEAHSADAIQQSQVAARLRCQQDYTNQVLHGLDLDQLLYHFIMSIQVSYRV